MSEIFMLTTLIIVGILSISLGWFIRNFAIGRVEGDSMYPTFRDGEIFLIRKRNFGIKAESVYLFQVEKYGYIIKRLAEIKVTAWNGNKSYYVLGDNTENSLDSRDFGYLPETSVKGKVIKITFWRNNDD